MSRWIVVISLLLLSACAHTEPLPPQAGLIAPLELDTTINGNDLVVNAMGYIGVPYRRGGTTAATGFDCSGFVRAMYQDTAGLLLPRRAEEQAAATQHIDRDELKPGDLVFFNTLRRAFSHVGIYVGNGKFIHSPRPGAHVRIEDMGLDYWRMRFNGARRVLTSAAQPQR